MTRNAQQRSTPGTALALAGHAAIEAEHASGLLLLIAADMECWNDPPSTAQAEVWAGMIRFVAGALMETVSPAAAAFNSLKVSE